MEQNGDSIVEYHRLEDKAAPAQQDGDRGDDHDGGTAMATVDDNGDDERRSRQREWAAFIELMVPTTITFLCRMGMALTDLAFLGHLASDPRFPGAESKDFLAAAGIAITWIALTDNFLYSGMAGALQTLVAQALGAGNAPLAGTWLVISASLSFACCVPVAVAWWFAGDVMAAALGPAKCDARCQALVSEFARYSVLWLWSNVAYVQARTYFRARGITRPQLVVSVLCLGINVGLNQLFVHGAFGWPGLGFRGSPVATAVSRALQTALFVGYAFGWKRLHADAWPAGPLWRQFSCVRVRRYLWQSMPLAVGGQLEEAQIQVVSFLAGRIGPDQIAAHNGLLEVFLFLTALQWGVMNATTVRVGVHLGDDRVANCKHVIRIAAKVGTAISVGISLVFVLGRHVIGRVYSNDAHIIALTEPLCWLAGAGYTALTIFYVCMAVLQAQGRTVAIAVSFFIGAWCFGVPSAWAFGFKAWWHGREGGLGLLGLWLGLTVGYGVTTLLALGNVWRSDWPKLARDAMERSEKEEDGDGNKQVEEEDDVVSPDTVEGV